ncbi:MAG TPA: DNA polymerase IV [Kofleriaceae bacterium]|jgi:DNA polymerase-4
MLAPRLCCLDLDTFFVSVERLFDPSLNGKPVIVGGRRFGGGVVVSCSYEARAFGIKSGLSVRDASQLAPREAVFVPGRHDAYMDFSAKARAIVERFSPVVIAASIDEHYIDFSGCERMYRRAGDTDDDATILRVVKDITGSIQRELGLPSSAGIATSIKMAKVASALAKPAGVLLVQAGTEEATLAPLPVRKLPGIGPVSEAKLNAIGIGTLSELVAAPDAQLRRVFGSYTAELRAAARGEGRDELGRERPAFREHDPHGVLVGSISNERTFVELDDETVPVILSSLCERVCSRARSRGITAGQVTLKLRYTDFHTMSRGRTITPTNAEFELHKTVLEIYREARTRPLGIRLVGIALHKLSLDRVQLTLFDGNERRGDAVDKVREKFGYDAVHLATTIARRR